jgi:hypothetical protein
MQRNPQAKSQAAILMREMNAAGTPIKHQQALEMVAKMSGFRDWNAMAAAPEAPQVPLAPSGPVAATGILSSAKVIELIDLARDVVNSCDSTGCDGLTVADEEMAWKLKEFLGNLDMPLEPVGVVPSAITNFNPKREVAIIWTVGDVQTVRPDLTDAEALDVLLKCKYKHDCDVGITWDVIRDVAGMYFSVPLLTGTVTFTDADIKEVSCSATVNLLKNGEVLIDGQDFSLFSRFNDGWFAFDSLPGEDFEIVNGKLCGNADDDAEEQSYELREVIAQLKHAGVLGRDKTQ